MYLLNFLFLKIFDVHIIDYPTPSNINYVWSFSSVNFLPLDLSKVIKLILISSYFWLNIFLIVQILINIIFIILHIINLCTLLQRLQYVVNNIKKNLILTNIILFGYIPGYSLDKFSFGKNELIHFGIFIFFLVVLVLFFYALRNKDSKTIDLLFYYTHFKVIIKIKNWFIIGVITSFITFQIFKSIIFIPFKTSFDDLLFLSFQNTTFFFITITIFSLITSLKILRVIRLEGQIFIFGFFIFNEILLIAALFDLLIIFGVKVSIGLCPFKFLRLSLAVVFLIIFCVVIRFTQRLINYLAPDSTDRFDDLVRFKLQQKEQKSKLYYYYLKIYNFLKKK